MNHLTLEKSKKKQHSLELSPESIANAQPDKTIVLSENLIGKNELPIKEQIGSTIVNIAFKQTPTKNIKLFQRSRLIDVQPDTNHFTKNDDLFNISFNMQDFNEILTENNDLKNFLEKIKSKFEMLLSECKEIETKLYISVKENEELKSKLENVQEKEQAQKDSTNRFVKFCEKEHFQIEARLEQSLDENKNLIDKISNLDRRSNLIKIENVELKDEIVKLDEENKLLNDKIKEKKK
ncbi:hypothetical protein BpHYR1_021268 [Brachionus plicatilis]|uniref:Uncharacterized protein n=1 Tax=Brachionus plicatilis TaxID=10195 RepID=A0A3M7QQM2_BRAPC|nr:hypothetical protein BpHYR1_021268 [Brachionus plicatilis]